LKDSKVAEILKTLDKAELKDLGKFIESPYFSRGRDVMPLFNALKTFHPSFDHPNLTREFIYNKIYPGKKYGDAKSDSLLKTLMSDLLKLCTEYLAYSEFKNDKSRRSTYLLKQLRERKLYKAFEKEYAVTKNSLSSYGPVNVDSFHDLYSNANEYTAYCIDTGNIQGVFDSLLSGGEYSLTHSLIKAFMNRDLKASTIAFNINYKPNFSDFMIESLDSEKMLTQMRESNSEFLPFIEVFYTANLMSKHPETDIHFFKLKSLLEKYIDLFEHSQKYILYSMLLSYCARKSTYGNDVKFVHEEFEIQDKILKLGIYRYSPKDDFQVNSFRNYVLTALDVNKIDWLEEFVEKYYMELHPDHRENMRYYTLAHVYFCRKEHEKALDYINKVKYNYFLFKIDVRYLMFRLYYEMGYDEQAFSTLSSIAQFLKESKDLSEGFRKRGNKFVKYSRELLRRKTERNTKDLDHFKKQVKESDDVNSRGWILEKIEEMGTKD
jgi:hypothetical protein